MCKLTGKDLVGDWGPLEIGKTEEWHYNLCYYKVCPQSRPLKENDTVHNFAPNRVIPQVFVFFEGRRTLRLIKVSRVRAQRGLVRRAVLGKIKLLE